MNRLAAGLKKNKKTTYDPDHTVGRPQVPPPKKKLFVNRICTESSD